MHFPTSLADLCRQIDLPSPMRERVETLAGGGDLPRLTLAPFCDPAGIGREVEAVRARLSPDPAGEKILAVMLASALSAVPAYRAAGLSPRIFADTMEAFARQVREHAASFGYPGFDRWWWDGRHLALRLFRLGCLEYEYTSDFFGHAGPVVSIHIPSGVTMTAGALADSVARARETLPRLHPAYAGAPMVCESWLLDPALEPHLGPDSRIRLFRSLFRVETTVPSDDYKTWLFGRADLAPEDFAEDTSLRRAIKAYVLSGGTMSCGVGLLVAE